MAISKDDLNKVYNFGIAEGRQLVKSYIDDEDIVDLGLEGFSKKDAKRLEKSTLEELTEFARNLTDGIEDGIKSQLGRETSAYVKWLRSQHD